MKRCLAKESLLVPRSQLRAPPCPWRIIAIGEFPGPEATRQVKHEGASSDATKRDPALCPALCRAGLVHLWRCTRRTRRVIANWPVPGRNGNLPRIHNRSSVGDSLRFFSCGTTPSAGIIAFFLVEESKACPNCTKYLRRYATVNISRNMIHDWHAP